MTREDLRHKIKGVRRGLNQAVVKKLMAQVMSKSAEPYTAFDENAEGRQKYWLHFILPHNELIEPYSQLTSMTMDAGGNTIVVNFANHLSVAIFGHSLQPLYEKLLRHEVEWIRSFNPKLWKTAPECEPYVLGIEIRRALH